MKNIYFCNTDEKRKNMKMTIKTALAVLFALFAANVVAEAQIIFPPTGVYPGDSAVNDTIFERGRLDLYKEDFIETPPYAFTQDANALYGPWHPFGFQFHMAAPDVYSSGSYFDSYCMVLAKGWIRVRERSEIRTIEVEFSEFDLYHMACTSRIGTINQCNECREKFLIDYTTSRNNIIRAVSLLTLSSEAFIRLPWTENEIWEYEVATPRFVSQGGNGDQRITWHTVNTNGVTTRVNDESVSTGINTSNVISYWGSYCKRKIRVCKLNPRNKIYSSFTVMSDIEMPSDNQNLPDYEYKQYCGIVTNERLPHVGPGPINNNTVLRIDFTRPPQYNSTLINNVTHYNAGSCTEKPLCTSYFVTPITANGGGSYSNPNTNLLADDDVLIAPNPTSDRISVILTNSYIGKCRIEIFNSLNYIEFSSEFEKTSSELNHTFDLKGLQSGIYYYRIIFDDASNNDTRTGTISIVK